MKIEAKKETIHISDLAKNLNVAHEIILNWEKEFKVSSSEINPIEYTYEEAKKFKTIKKLLHKKKLSIEQTKEFLTNNSQSFMSAEVTEVQPEISGKACPVDFDTEVKVKAVLTTAPFESTEENKIFKELSEELLKLKNKLIELKSRL